MRPCWRGHRASLGADHISAAHTAPKTLRSEANLLYGKHRCILPRRVANNYCNERVTCLACVTSLVIEYAPNAEAAEARRSISVTCPACQHVFDVVLPQAAAVFIVRRSGDTPVFGRRLGNS